MITIALILLAQAGGPSSGPSDPSEPATGSISDLSTELTMVFDIDEGWLNTQESWTVHNPSGAAVGDRLVLELPSSSRRLKLEESVKGFVARENATAIESNGPIGTGEHQIHATYQLATSGSSVVIKRRLATQTNAARVIIEDLPDLSITSNSQPSKRKRELNGVNYAIFDFPPLSSGSMLEVKLSGLPSKSHAPKIAAVAAVGLIVLWALYAGATGRAPGAGASAMGPLSPMARRDRVLKAIELLDEDLKAEKISEKKYARRHEDLMADLAQTLREIDLEEATKRAANST
ncbi:MAG: hypothetical protein HY791_13920 [Deltaproteobacteria bacterium]|nr:hypothetical protein [Deltaproteobacteria bacterium]